MQCNPARSILIPDNQPLADCTTQVRGTARLEVPRTTVPSPGRQATTSRLEVHEHCSPMLQVTASGVGPCAEGGRKRRKERIFRRWRGPQLLADSPRIIKKQVTAKARHTTCKYINIHSIYIGNTLYYSSSQRRFILFPLCSSLRD
jgi:hypothetical protein